MTPPHPRDQDTQRADVKDRLRRGSTSLSQVLQEAQADDVIGGMRVSDLLGSLPEVDDVRTHQIMNRLGIAESGLVRELSAGQRTALEGEYGRPRASVGSTPDWDSQGEDYEEDDENEGDEEPEEIPQDGEGWGIEDWDRL
jgi:hypothetical protein